MQRLISALQPTPAYWDAKHTAGHVQSPLTCQCDFAQNQRSAEPNHDQLPYTASSSKHSARQHEHSEPMASIRNRTSVLQVARTRSIHAERCLPIHAGQRRQHYRPGTPSSGSFESLKARGRETGPFFEELNHRAEVTPSLNQPFFACTWLRLRPYAHISSLAAAAWVGNSYPSGRLANSSGELGVECHVNDPTGSVMATTAS